MINRKPHFFRKPDGGYIKPIFKIDGLQKLVKAIPSFDDSNNGKHYGLALVILEYIFGFQWVEKHILNEPSNGFLSRLLGSEEGSAMITHRITNLAEFIVNMMPIRGIEASLDQISRGHIESGYAELEVGKLLLIRDVIFRFIWPSGVKGESFDLEIMFPNGKTVCADTKCQLETGSYSAKGLRNKLDHARKQLPKDYPGVIFIKIPQKWHINQDLLENIEDVCQEFFRGTKRIVSIEIYSAIVEIENNILYDRYIGTEFRNQDHRFVPSINWRLFTFPAIQHLLPANPQSWRRLVDIAQLS